MSVTPEQKWEADRLKAQRLHDVMQMINQQINRSVDSIHARLYWTRVLDEMPKDILVDALSMALSSGRYQEVPRCCCKR